MTCHKSTTYLEILHATIARMAGHSFVAKRWSVALAAAVLGFAVSEAAPKMLWVGTLGVSMFWIVDAYYLALERGFRKRFETEAERRLSPEWEERFEMDPQIALADTVDAAWAPAVLMVHLPLLGALLVGAVLL